MPANFTPNTRALLQGALRSLQSLEEDLSLGNGDRVQLASDYAPRAQAARFASDAPTGLALLRDPLSRILATVGTTTSFT